MPLNLRPVLGIVVACSLVIQVGAQASLPGPPEGFTASSNGLNLTLSWRPPASGGPILYYTLDIGTEPGTYLATVPVGPVTTITTPIDEGTYYFRVAAVNAVGAGPPSPEVAVTVGGSPVPGPPENVNATVSETSVTLSWDPPTSGAGVREYLVTLSDGAGHSLGSASVGLQTSIPLPLLPVGLYVFSVAAHNDWGTGPAVEISFTVGVATSLPGPPRDLAATGGIYQLTFSWSPPAEGAPILNYILEIGITPGEYPFSIAVGPATSSSPGALPNGTYYFRVTAVNSIGVGPPSAEAGVRVGGPQTPSEPRSVVATATDSTLTFSWEPPIFGAPLAGYFIEVGLEPGIYLYTGPIGDVTSLSVPVPPLGVYFYRVSAINAYGRGDPSQEMSVVVGTATELPGPPQNLFAMPGSNGTVFRWSPPLIGTPITDYLLEIGLASGDYVFSTSVGPVTSFTLPGGIGAATVYFRVTPFNALGRGTPSDEAGVRPGPPSAPRNFTVSAAAGAVSFSWSPPTFGAPIASYYLEFGTQPGVYVGGTALSPLTTSLTAPLPDGLYYFRLTAGNGYGRGESVESSVYTGPPCTVPGAPVLSGSVSGSTVTLSWTTPSGGPIDGYSILLTFQPGMPETVIATVGDNTITGPASTGTYLVRVRAHAPCGSGGRSNQISLTVP